VRFGPVTIEEAHSLLGEQENRLQSFKSQMEESNPRKR
jgi:hypothetical protein